jgi:hypothetical protein
MVVFMYRVFTMKCTDCEGIFKIGSFFQVLRVSYLLLEFKFPPELLGYFRGHRWVAPAVQY